MKEAKDSQSCISTLYSIIKNLLLSLVMTPEKHKFPIIVKTQDRYHDI